jgi:hypothetical protein
MAIVKTIHAFGWIKSLLACSCFIGVGLVFLRISYPVMAQFNYERELLKSQASKTLSKENKNMSEVNDPNGSNSMGDINVTKNSAPTQISIGSPGSSQIVNQRRAFSPQVTVEKLVRGNDHVLRINLNQTSGFWDQGTEMRISAKFSGKYKSAKIIQGLPPITMMVQMAERKEEGEFFYSTITAPIPNSPIVIEVLASEEIKLVQIIASPLAG